MLIAAILCTFMVTLPAQPAAVPTIAIAWQPAVGVSEQEMLRARERMVGEIEDLGAVVHGISPAVDAACLSDAACLEAARAALPSPPEGLLVVALVRVGPVLQLTASTSAPNGADTSTHGLDAEQLATGALLPPATRVWVTSLIPPAQPLPTDRPVAPVVLAPAAPESSPGAVPLPIAAIALGSAGTIAALVGVVLIGINAPILEDPDSLGADKEGAAVGGFVGVATTLVGLALVGVGVGLLLGSE